MTNVTYYYARQCSNSEKSHWAGPVRLCSYLFIMCLTVVVLSCISLPKHTTPKNLKPCRDYLVKKYQAEASSAVVIYGEEIGVWIDNSKTVTTQAEASHAGVEILYYLESHCPDCCSANYIWIYFRKISRCVGLTYKMTSTDIDFPFECKQNANESNGAANEGPKRTAGHHG